MEFFSSKKTALALSFVFAFLLMIPGGHAEAKSASWSSGTILDSFSAIIYDQNFCWRDCGDSDPDRWGIVDKYVSIAETERPSATVQHTVTIVDNTTGANIDDGDTVPVGDTFTITPQANAPSDISWFETGGEVGSPYGTWGGGAFDCTNNPKTSPAWLQENQVTDSGTETFDSYGNLAVQPTTPSVSKTGSAGLSCNGNVCKVTSAGTIGVSVTYPATTGNFYFSYYKAGQIQSGQDWSGPDGCNRLPNPQASQKSLLLHGCTFDPNSPMSDSCLADSSNYNVVQVPAINVSYAFNAAAPTAPPPPTITGPTEGDNCSDSEYTYTFKGTASPASDSIVYGIDWDHNGAVDEWLPATGSVPSGTPQSTTHSWPNQGVKTFQALTKDVTTGAVSGWTQYSVTIDICAVPQALLTATPTTISAGDSSTLQWTCTNSTSAFIDRGVGDVTPTDGGTVDVSPTNDLTYQLWCKGPGGTATDTATVAVSNLPNLNPIGFVPTVVVAGQPYVFTATIQNTAGIATPSAFPSDIYVCHASDQSCISGLALNFWQKLIASITSIARADDALDIVLNPLSLAAHATRTTPSTNPVTFATAGNYRAELCADTPVTSPPVDVAQGDTLCTPKQLLVVCPAGDIVEGDPPACQAPATLNCTDDAVNPVKAGTVIHFNTAGTAVAPFLWQMNGTTVPGTGSTNSYTMPDVDGPYTMTVSASGANATCSPAVTEGCGSPTGNLSANPLRVNPKTVSEDKSRLSWSGLSGGDGSAWTVQGNDGSSYPVGTPNDCDISDGGVTTGPISGQTTYCLYSGTDEAMGSDGKPACVTVNVIPNFQEF